MLSEDYVMGWRTTLIAGVLGLLLSSLLWSCGGDAAGGIGPRVVPESSGPASGSSTDPSVGFSIELRFVDDTFTPTQRDLIMQSASRWSRLITGDLPNVYLLRDRISCLTTLPGLDQWVDDVLIDVGSQPIDGNAGTLAIAGPCIMRSQPSLPVYGAIVIDSADLTRLENEAYFESVVLHEITHVLGFGVLWPFNNLIGNPGSQDPVYLGLQGTAQYIDLGGQGLLPIDASGVSGSRDVHWRESVLGNELMTGSLNTLEANPLSRITIGAMMDLGYQFQNPLADAYGLPLNLVNQRAQVGKLVEWSERILTHQAEVVDQRGRILRHQRF